MKHILLLEDELSDALGIELIVKDIPGVEITHVSTLEDAEREYTARHPDAIISDIRLKKNKVSLDWLKDKTPSIPTIILTQNYSDEYYQQAKLIGARAYLVKPVDKVTLKYELERMLNIGPSDPNDTVVIKDGTKFHSIAKNTLLWIHTEGNYSTIRTESKKIVIRISLLRIINLLKDNRFIQVHRSAIVSLKRIKLVDVGADIVIMDDGTEIPLGQKYKSELTRRLIDYANLL